MTLLFTREVLIVEGFPVIGTVTVTVNAQRDPYDRLWQLDLEVTAFEPEDRRTGLQWATLAGPVEDWLSQNKARVEKKALRGPEPCKTPDKNGSAPAASFR